MKKNFINLAMVAMVAVGTVAYTGCGKKGCTNEADDKFDSAATESDPEACDPTATTNKYVGSWTFAIGGSSSNTYTGSVTNNGDYKLTLTTNFGLTGGVAPFNVPLSVSQNTATSSAVQVGGVGNGTVTVDEFKYISANSSTIKVTYAGFANASINGTYTDNGTK